MGDKKAKDSVIVMDETDRPCIKHWMASEYKGYHVINNLFEPQQPLNGKYCTRL